MRVRPNCSIEHCDKPNKAQTYCNKHYKRLRATGSPTGLKNVRGGQRHGLSRTPTWYSWVGMIERATSKKHRQYKDYGGRGIKACDRWLERRGFINFLEDMGERPKGKTLDRIDNDGDYTPENCRWATYSEQCQNRRPRTKVAV